MATRSPGIIEKLMSSSTNLSGRYQKANFLNSILPLAEERARGARPIG